MNKDFVQHDYQIDIDDNDSSIRKYYLNGQPLEFVDSSLVTVGSMVWFDKYNQKYGIVQGLRNDKYFRLYDVFDITSGKIEEVVEFRVYRLA